MNFWKVHDLALIRLRRKTIILMEEFEKNHKVSEKNYNKKLNRFINRKLGKSINILTALSIRKSLQGLNL